MPPRLILASASPRRRDLLLQAGFQFEVQAADADETALPNEDGVALAVRLARAKAMQVAGTAGHESVVLGADTVVIAPDGELLGKPLDTTDAARMLRLLGGSTHQVVTGVCVSGFRRLQTAASLTYVHLHSLSEPEIAAYVAGGEPTGKAGAYAIQGRAARWVAWIHGDYSNVVGLPLALVAEMLAPFSVVPA